MVSVCTVPARGGRSCERFGGYKTKTEYLYLYEILKLTPIQRTRAMGT